MLLLGLVLLAGCMRSAPDTSVPEPTIPTLTPEGGQAPLPLAPSPLPSTPDSALPAVLLTQPTDAGPLYLIHYQGGQGRCLALTFDPQTLAVNRCGLASGQGVGFVDQITAPDGRVARAAYGLTPGGTITAVAIEFSGGGNTPALVAGEGYMLLLENGQTPRRATAIDQYGYMAGQWGF